MVDTLGSRFTLTGTHRGTQFAVTCVVLSDAVAVTNAHMDGACGVKVRWSDLTMDSNATYADLVTKVGKKGHGRVVGSSSLPGTFLLALQLQYRRDTLFVVCRDAVATPAPLRKNPARAAAPTTFECEERD